MMDWGTSTLVLIAVLLFFMLIGVPVAFSLGMTAVVGTVLFLGSASLINLANTAFNKGSDNLFIVAPLFIFMAGLISYSGVAQRAFDAARCWTDRVPGSLGVSSVLASAAFSSVSGSSPATAATVGYVAIPEMLRHGYSKRIAAGVIAAGGTLGILIPPSITMILFGIITETSIASLFIAGILPGLLIASLLILYTVGVAVVRPALAPRANVKYTWRQRFSSLNGLWGLIVLFTAVLGSLYLGIVTPAEAAAVGAGGALLLFVFSRNMSLGLLAEALTRSAQTTAMVMFLIFGGFALSYVITAQGIGHGLSSLLIESGANPWLIMIAYNILLILMGMIMEPGAMIVITMPILFPVFVEMGFDPVWLGVITTINAEIAMITPPVGLNLFILKGVVPRNVDLSDIMLGAIPYAMILVLGLLIVLAFPDIAVWLPERAAAR